MIEIQVLVSLTDHEQSAVVVTDTNVAAAQLRSENILHQDIVVTPGAAASRRIGKPVAIAPFAIKDRVAVNFATHGPV